MHALFALLTLTAHTVLHWQLYIAIFRTIKADCMVSDTIKAEESEWFAATMRYICTPSSHTHNTKPRKRVDQGKHTHMLYQADCIRQHKLYSQNLGQATTKPIENRASFLEGQPQFQMCSFIQTMDAYGSP